MAAAKGFEFIQDGKRITAVQERDKIARSIRKMGIQQAQLFAVGYFEKEEDRIYLNTLKRLVREGKRKEALELIRNRHRNRD